MSLNLILITSLLSILKTEILIIPFEKNEEKKPFNFTKDIIENLMYTNISVGTPYQKIKSYITLNKGAFYISDYYIPKQFDINLSSTFNFESNDMNFSSDEEFIKGKLSKDILQFLNIKGKNIILSNITFIYATNCNNNLKPFPSGLGFMLKTVPSKQKYNFLYQLKEKNIISSYTFTIKFKNENSGQIIIGDYPHIYNNNFILRDFQYTKILDFDNFFQWKFQIEKVFNNEEVIENKVKVIISLNYGICIGGNTYLKIINSTFFKEYIEKGICEYKLSDNNLIYFFECNSNIEISKFPKLKFYQKIMNYTFELDYNDLFILKDEKLYFLIGFRKRSSYDWVLGVPFLKKFQLVFDQEREIIGIYTNFNKKKNDYFFKILTVCCLLIIVFLISLLYKIIHKKRKIRANELEENFEYISEENLF